MARNENLPQAIPAELDKWNWGAFLLTWIWGLGNSTFRALLMFVPIVNIVMWIMLGVKGSQWAWENAYWRDAEHFRKTQRAWAIAGFAVIVGMFVVFGGLFFAIISGFKGSDAYQQAMSQLRASPVATEVLGTPIKDGFFPGGKISVNAGGTGKARLRISVSGPKRSGTAHVWARKSGGQWTTRRLWITFKDGTTPVSIINTTGGQPIPDPEPES